MSTAPSWLIPHPVGVLTWLLHAGDSEERALFEHLLLRADATRTDAQALARSTGQNRSAVARALFALVRTESLSVHVEPPTPFIYRNGGLACLQADLLELAQPGQKLLLANHEGFCLASVGCTRYEESVLAAAAGGAKGAMHDHALHFANHRIHLMTSRPIDGRNPALLQLGRRLLVFYGGLIYGDTRS
ncbi:hypothetical protein [Ralstonia pseudosolanacearum]|uniref:hypothetical protein n=1 Tax=Ralstonia pseudosolanacearum TaxID=1310165 RepID=UPI00115FE86F|nr:hypothetical protein [Ralstonia pseudosolanacearum]MCL1622591.1 hypothetical protein [Ralstonia pseudosolanacearum CaRs-Mep]